METVSRSDAGGKHRQSDGGVLRVVEDGAEQLRVDDQPTEQLPPAIDPGPGTEGEREAASGVEDPGPDGAPAEPPPADETIELRNGLPERAEARAADDTSDPGRVAPDLPAPDRSAPEADVAPAEQAEPAPAAAAAFVEPVPARAAAAPARRARIARGVGAAVAVLLVVAVLAWLATGLLGAGDDDEAVPPGAGGAQAAAVPAVFGEQVPVDGWLVEIGEPAAADVAGDAELPVGAERAVRLEITLTNDGEAPRDSAGWVVRATADGRAVELLATDGRDTGAVPSRTVLPGASLGYAVEVPMPAAESELQMEALAPGFPAVLFVGTA
jgi:hypothetical protein